MYTEEPYLYKNILTEQDTKTLLEYFAIDDDKTDSRPDVRSKHPDWEDTEWPKSIIAGCLNKIFPNGFRVEDISLRQDRIGLKPHTDFGSLPGTKGKTVLLLLTAEPEAHTIFFNNYWPDSEPEGAFFTKKWNPYTYKLENKTGDLVQVEDLRDFLTQCKEQPDTIEDFEITNNFISEIERLIHIRSLPILDKDNKNKDTGFTQPAPRKTDYNCLTNYDSNRKFDKAFHRRYFCDIDINDLHGLEVDRVIDWEINGAIIFDREQLHAASNCHLRKTFVTIFCHSL